MGISEIILLAIFGLVVGLVARFIMPGKDPMGLIMTSILGIAGSFLGTYLGRMWLPTDYQNKWLMAILGALVLLFLYRILFQKRD
jgi:uncharacterized membrane protein YeaQ/YmgE (transglycosylase-associated protein family)